MKAGEQLASPHHSHRLVRHPTGLVLSMLNGFVPLTNTKLKITGSRVRLLCSHYSHCVLQPQLGLNADCMSPSSHHQPQQYSRHSLIQTSRLFLSWPILLFPSINPCLISDKKGGRRWRVEGRESLALSSSRPHSHSCTRVERQWSEGAGQSGCCFLVEEQ